MPHHHSYFLHYPCWPSGYYICFVPSLSSFKTLLLRLLFHNFTHNLQVSYSCLFLSLQFVLPYLPLMQFPYHIFLLCNALAKPFLSCNSLVTPSILWSYLPSLFLSNSLARTFIISYSVQSPCHILSYLPFI